MSDILDWAREIAANSPAAQAQAKLDEVQRYIRHGQIDGKWGTAVDHAQLMMVSRHTLPDGMPFYLAGFQLAIGIHVWMLLAEHDGEYIKMPPDGVWGAIQIVGEA